VAEDISLRPLTAGDEFLVRRWLRQPDVHGWWGTQSAAEAEVNLGLASPSAICRLICAGATPIGYAQAADALLWRERLPSNLAAGAWDIDLVIAVAEHRHAAVAMGALALLVGEVETTTLAVAACAFVPATDETAVRLFENAGFRWRSIVRDPVGRPEWLMVRERR